MTALAVSSETFEREVLQSKEPVLVDFFAEYCRPCKAMEPVLNEAAKELQGRVKIMTLDVPNNRELAEKYAVRGMPTLLLFNEGKPLARHVGAIMQKAKLAEWIDAFVTASDPVLRTTELSLSNGMKVVVIAHKSAPDVAHAIHFKAGAADAPKGESGIGYALCSLMSGRVGEPDVRVRSLCTHDATYYEQRTTKELLPAVMERSADHIAAFRFTADEVDALRQNALEHLDPRENRGRQLYQKVNSALFGAHPYAIPEEGLEGDLAALTHESVRQFHKRYYAPNNAVLVVAGDVTADEVRELAEATYGKVSAHPDVGERARSLPEIMAAPRRFSANVPSSRGSWFTRKHVVPSYVTARFGEAEALELIEQILGRNTGALHRRLVDEEKLATYAGASYSGHFLGHGTFVFSAKLLGRDIERVDAIVAEIVDEFRSLGPTQADVERAREALKVRRSGSSKDGNGLASRYGEALALGRSIAEVDGWSAAIDQVTAEDIKNVANACLDPGRAATGWLLVEESSANAAGDVFTTAP